MILNLHIGYAKTATTFLQEHIFPNISGIDYAGRYINRLGDERDNLDWVYQFAKTANLDAKAIIKTLPNSKQQNCLMSHEVIMRPYKLDEALSALDSLQNHIEHLRILISIRNPVDLIFSRYVHDISTGIFKPYSLKEALDYAGHSECMWPMCGNSIKNKLWRKSPFNGGSCLCNKKKVKSINIPYYELDTLNKKLETIFRSDKVHYIVSERLKAKPENEIDRLCNFLDNGITAAKFDPKLLDSSDNSNQRSNLDIYQKLKQENIANGVLGELIEYFKLSNRAFAERTGMDVLGNLGYY